MKKFKMIIEDEKGRKYIRQSDSAISLFKSMEKLIWDRYGNRYEIFAYKSPDFYIYEKEVNFEKFEDERYLEEYEKIRKEK